MRLKEVKMKERHEREIFNLKQQLTSNQCLWEQLSESQTRESILSNELHFTQQSLATWEKTIEKLKNELANLQNQRLRLQQYKDNKSKRLDELESKVRQMEILENIDLNKLLDELRLRDRKLNQLSGIEKNLQRKVDSIYKVSLKFYPWFVCNFLGCRLESRRLKKWGKNICKRKESKKVPFRG